VIIRHSFLPHLGGALAWLQDRLAQRGGAPKGKR
jgi:hypothetical protein